MRSEKRKNTRLATKVMIAVSVFGVVVSVSLFAILNFWVIPQVELKIREKLMAYSEIAANLVDTEAHSRIVSNGLGETSPEYQVILAELNKIKMTNPQIDSIYTMIKTDDSNKVSFIIDTFETKDRNNDGIISDDETKATVGETYDVSEQPILKQGFSYSSVDEKPNSDKWGTFVSSYAPIKDAGGKVIAAVGTDMRYDEVLAQERQLLIRFSGYIIVYLLIVLSLGTLLSRIIVRAVGNLSVSVREISDENSTGLLDDSGGDEMSELSKSINDLLTNLRSARAESDKKVVEKTKSLEEKLEEVEKLNKLMVGREVIMYDLKKRLRNLTKDEKA